MGLGEACWKFDAEVIDGTVNGAGWATRESGTVSSWWDKWIIDGLLVNGVAMPPGRCRTWRALCNGDWCSGTHWSWSAAWCVSSFITW